MRVHPGTFPTPDFRSGSFSSTFPTTGYCVRSPLPTVGTGPGYSGYTLPDSGNPISAQGSIHSGRRRCLDLSQPEMQHIKGPVPEAGSPYPCHICSNRRSSATPQQARRASHGNHRAWLRLRGGTNDLEATHPAVLLSVPRAAHLRGQLLHATLRGDEGRHGYVRGGCTMEAAPWKLHHSIATIGVQVADASTNATCVT